MGRARAGCVRALTLACWVLSAAVGVGCAAPEAVEPTPPQPPQLDLYFVPPSLAPQNATVGGWPFLLEDVSLSTTRAGRPELDIPPGGHTTGEVVQLSVSEDGLEVETLPVISRVEARDERGRTFVGTVENDAFSNEFLLRTPAGRYALWVEPYDRSLVPRLIEGVELPQAPISVVIGTGKQVRGVLTDGDPDDPQPLAGVQITPRDLIDHHRTGSVGVTSDTGSFSVRVGEGKHGLWLQRDSSTASGARPIPATLAKTLTVGQATVPTLSLSLEVPETSPLSGQVQSVDRLVDGALVTATRVTSGSSPEGSLEVSTYTGVGAALNLGSFTLNLPEGSYVLTIEPPAGTVDALAPLTYLGGQPLLLPTESDGLSVSLDSYVVNLRGELLEANLSSAARGTSLLFLPDDPELPAISSLARGELANFTVGVTPPGGDPIALAPGSHDVIMSPPLGSTSARLSSSQSAVPGQTRLLLPPVPDGYAVFGQLTGGTAASFENAVVRAVRAGTPTWDVRWGPGPDPRDVLAEALVQDDGSFQLRLAY